MLFWGTSYSTGHSYSVANSTYLKLGVLPPGKVLETIGQHTLVQFNTGCLCPEYQHVTGGTGGARHVEK